MLRRALKSGAKPEALVVDCDDSFLAGSPEVAPRLYAALLDRGQTRELARSMRRADFASKVLTLQALGAAKDRFKVRRALLRWADPPLLD